MTYSEFYIVMDEWFLLFFSLHLGQVWKPFQLGNQKKKKKKDFWDTKYLEFKYLLYTKGIQKPDSHNLKSCNSSSQEYEVFSPVNT